MIANGYLRAGRLELSHSSAAHLADLEASSTALRSLAPRADDERFDLAVVLAAQNTEEAVLAPILTPRVRRQPVLDRSSGAGVLAPSERLLSFIRSVFTFPHPPLPDQANRVVALSGVARALVARQIRALVHAAAVHEEVFMDDEGGLHRTVRHNLRHDILLLKEWER